MVSWFFSYSLQICKSCIVVSRCLDFSTCHCIMPQQPICGIAKSCVFSKNMGCLWNNHFNFVPNYFWLCFEPNLWTLVACRCLVIYHIHLSRHLWKVGLSNYFRQSCWKRCLWLRIEGVHDPNETINFIGFSTLCFFSACISQEKKKHNMLALMLDPRFYNMQLDIIFWVMKMLLLWLLNMTRYYKMWV